MMADKEYEKSNDSIEKDIKSSSSADEKTKDFEQSIDGIDKKGNGLVEEQADRFEDNAADDEGRGE